MPDARKTPLTFCEVEERAAIIAEGCGVSKRESEGLTAKEFGFKSWGDMMEVINAQ